mmetsp:Transcript_37248/g.32939  ORF Transcript_37248/g.32939 Transcript_37248/m.32939 type:complete len:120 (+) Transcript_37248:174-533(+)
MTAKAIQNKNNGKYYVLIISCPACGQGKESRWYHANNNCMKHTEINEWGYVRCTSAHGDAFFNWRWDCGRHNGIFKKANQEYLASSLRHLLTSHKLTENGSFGWYMSLVANVGAQFKEN